MLTEDDAKGSKSYLELIEIVKNEDTSSSYKLNSKYSEHVTEYFKSLSQKNVLV